MPKLVIKKDQVIVKKFTVPADMVAFTIGCERGNDIIIKDDTISYFHLQIEKQYDRYYVRDLQSQWGTYVNGEKISTRTAIEDQDEIRLGGHKIILLIPENTEQPANATVSEARGLQHANPFVSGAQDRISGIPRFEQLNRWLDTDSEEYEPISRNGSTRNTSPQATDALPDSYTLEKSPTPSESDIEAGSPGSSQTVEPFDFDADLDSFIVGDYDPVVGHDPRMGHDEIPVSGIYDAPLTEAKSNSDFLVDDPEADRANDIEQSTSTTHEDSEATASPPEGENPEPPEGLNQVYCLLGIHGAYSGRRFKVREPKTRIGRDHKLNDIVISKNSKGEMDQSVSRRHATLRRQDSTWLLSDKRSKSRTRLNGRKLSETEELPVMENDEIEIISDQKSHIFRLVKEGSSNYSFPKKAGSWSVRHRMQMVHLTSAALLLVSLFVLVNALRSRHFIVSKPSELIADETYWANAQTGPERAGGLVSPAVADFNSDGYLDIIYLTAKGHLNCINGKDKEPLWRNSDFSVQPDLEITVADLDDDDRFEIIVVASDNTVRILDGAWGIERNRSPILAGPLTGAPVVADINGDRLKDIAIASSSGGIHLGRASLRDINWQHLSLPVDGNAIVSAGNVLGAASANLILASADGKISFVDAFKGQTLGQINVADEFDKAAGQHIETGAFVFPVALGDLDGDGYDDFTITTTKGNLLAVSGKTRSRLWYDFVQAGPQTGRSNSNHVVVGDLDGDGLLDIVSLSSGRRIRALKGVGEARDREMLLWQQNSPPAQLFAGYPVLADFNKNGTMDVVVACNDGAIYIYEGATGEPILEHKARGPALKSQPMIADLDSDNHLDIITLKQDGYIYKLRTSTLTTAGMVAWGQAFGNSRHTNASKTTVQNTGKYDLMIILSMVTILLVAGIQFYFHRSRAKLEYY